jgi:hypothetical protein
MIAVVAERGSIWDTRDTWMEKVVMEGIGVVGDQVDNVRVSCTASIIMT